MTKEFCAEVASLASNFFTSERFACTFDVLPSYADAYLSGRKYMPLSLCFTVLNYLRYRVKIIKS